MSQPTLHILSLAQKLRKEMHSRSYAMHHVLRHAKGIGYPISQAYHIVSNVYSNSQPWRSWG